MRWSGLVVMVSMVAMVSLPLDARAWPGGRGWGGAAERVARRGCVRVSTDLKVGAGESARRRVTTDLDVALEARATGWVVRVLPHSGPAPAVDFAEIASPPYRSVSPLLLTTDFGFRAQDTVGWNPREFHFVADRRMYGEVEPAYRAVTRSPRPDPTDEASLIRLLASASPGRIDIVDASLVPGTADRSRAAAGVSSRYGETPHVLVAPNAAGGGGPLGRVTGLTVRISLEVIRGRELTKGREQIGSRAAGGDAVTVSLTPCSVSGR